MKVIFNIIFFSC